MTTWSADIEKILDDVRENSVWLSTYHKQNYFWYKKISNYFRLPTITLSGIASVASVGLTAYVSQQNISGITCLLSLCISIINSFELYLRITETTERELNTSKAYYNLSIDLHKLLNLSQSNRQGDPIQTLEVFYKRYVDLVEESNLLSINYPDKLSKLPKIQGLFSKLKTKKSDSSSSSSSSINSNPLDDIESNSATL